MKQLIITLICACTALAVMAGAPRSDSARLRQALKNRLTASTSVTRGKTTGQVSLRQLMSARNVTPGDNRLNSRSSRSLPPGEFQGDRIAAVEAYPLSFDDEGAHMSDTAFNMGWNANISSVVAGEELSGYIIEGFHGAGSLPLLINEENQTAFLSSGYLAMDTLPDTNAAFFSWTDTVRSQIFYTADFFFDDVDHDLVGTVCDDGSIMFDGQYVIYTELELLNYRRLIGSYEVASRDTIAYISPVYSNLCLMKPNGVHECDYHNDGIVPQELSWQEFDGEFGKVINVAVFDGSGIIVGFDDGTGTLGLHPRPIDPRKPSFGSTSPQGNAGNDGCATRSMNLNSLSSTTTITGRSALSLDGLSKKNSLGGLSLSDLSGCVSIIFGDGPLGYHPKPRDPKNPGTLRSPDSRNSDSIPTKAYPVYMFQLNDSTLCVYNLFGNGYMMNFMSLDAQGNMTLPGQPMFYEEAYYEDFFNCSVAADSLFLGNTGVASLDTITWDMTRFSGLGHGSPVYYDNNRLYFTDGSKFELPALLGDVNRDRNVSITDVTILINHLLSSDFEKTETFSPVAADVNKDEAVTITDVTRLINLLLSGTHQ